MPAFKKVNPKHRKLKLTDTLIAEICNMMRAGAYIETAAAVAGVSKETLFVWLRKGRHHKGDKSGEVKKNIYGDLIHAVHKASEESMLRDLLVIDKAANPVQNAVMLKNEKGQQLYDKDGLPHFIKPQSPDWSAAAWRLERRHGKLWNKIEKTEQAVAITEKPPLEPLDEKEVNAAIAKLESDY